MKRTKNILFIIPPYFQMKAYKSKELQARAPIFSLPWGVLSISSYIKAYSNYDVTVEVLDLNREAYKLCSVSDNFELDLANLIVNKINDIKPNLVGISALFNTCYNYFELISSTCKRINSNMLIVMGGGIATNLYDVILRDFQYIDALCFGEGEIPMLELIDSENADKYLASNSSWITRQSLAEGRVPTSHFVMNLDDIPLFDKGLMDLNEYKGRQADKLSDQKNVRQLSIFTSRGCPFNCIFCSSSTVHGKSVRFMSADKVISDVREMVNTYGMNVLGIEDDHFLAKKEHAKDILRRLREFDIRIEFPNGMAIYAIDEEIGTLLKAAGVTTVSLAMESGSAYVLKEIIDKPLKLDMVKGAVDILRRNDICVHCCIVLGLPGELETHRDETMQMILKTGFDWTYFNLAVPVVGSRLYKICKEKGYMVNDDFGEHYTSKGNIRTPDIDPAYMEEKAYLMNLEANFVRNYNLNIGDYKKAYSYFQNIVNTYPDHAFAYYFLSKALEGLGNDRELAKQHRETFNNLIATNSTWAKYAKKFSLSEF